MAFSETSIGIVGTGSVGASVAISLLTSGVTRKLLLHDKNTSRALGEAMDLAHGSSFYPTATVQQVETLSELQKTDAVIITAGRNGSPTESRLDLLRDNAAIMRAIASEFVDYKGIIIIVSNPVDVLTYVFQQASGLPITRVLGTGTMLDTARLRNILGRELNIEPRSIHAQVAGEHGDSEVVLWSSATLGGTDLRSWPDWTTEKEEHVATEVRTAAYEIIQRKGVTNHAIGLVTATLVKWILRGDRRILTVSRVQNGMFGYRDLAISLPTIVSINGAETVLEPAVDPTEKAALDHSADVIKQAIASLTP
ncbi:L-lactate dehydrogenase [[Leptolyngbya] sp. PCC 7376]|uniref:L-lactate dehydrogenase n=1 Tax=[Leptolyngbya] sp. PCC 7376 TaxID=111781 RepID=UPI00029F0051|nr:L-lactate dehydrogenase [[Leptolyngbya] sp. PCC 7376]AFY38960.1 L-lactate dehydrogenase [[Leptolyngbya] sp. PCC 7376]